MKESMRIVRTLCFVALIAGASLVFVSRWATPKIKANQEEAFFEAVKSIFKGAEGVELFPSGQMQIYRAMDSKGVLLGYVFTQEGKGYAGTIGIMVGLSPDLNTIEGIEILESQETPGLGGEIITGWFRKQFKGLNAGSPIGRTKREPVKENNEIQAISGATISTDSVLNILNDSIPEVIEIMRGK